MSEIDTAKIRVNTEGFRAIGSADIIIDGITVVAGENGCGKSTLSKLLYYLYKTATNYDLLVAKSLKPKFRNLREVLDEAVHELDRNFYRETKEKERKGKIEVIDELYKLDRDLTNRPLTASDKEKWILIIKKITDAFSEYENQYEKGLLFKRPSNRRIRYILNELLNRKDDKKYPDNEEQVIPWEEITYFAEEIFEEAFIKMKTRPVSLFIDTFRQIFRENKLPHTFDVFELGEEIISINKDNLATPFLIKNTIYIDTPMMFGVKDGDNEYWNDLNDLINKKTFNPPHELSHVISGDMIGGDVLMDSKRLTNELVYKRADGEIFNLKDVATGIKAFGIIELLLNNGSITDKTLLIIDEPESNLHPQWIIEYARLIVLMHKHIGVKFFIATHNPDMVSALKYISAKEGINDDLNFYLAEKAEGRNHQYNYKLLRQEIDPIFESFNIALDRINKYGI